MKKLVSQDLLKPLGHALSLSVCVLVFILFCFLTACRDHEKNVQNSQKVIPPPPPPFSLKGIPEDLKLSEEVVSFGGSNLILELTTQVQSVTAKLLSTPLDLRDMWLKTYIQSNFLFTYEHVDETRPLRFIQLLHQGEPHTVRLIGIKDLQALKESIGTYLDELKEGEQTLYAQRRYKQDSEPLYFAVLSHNVIASTKVKALLSTAHLGMYEQLACVRFQGLGAVHLYPKRILSGWGDRVLLQAEEQVEEFDFKGSTSSQERQRALLSTGTQWLQMLAKGSERVVLAAQFMEDRLSIKADWRAQAESSLEKSFHELEAGPHLLLSLLSQPTPLALSLNLKPHQLAQLTAFLNEGPFTKALLRNQDGLLEDYLTKAVTAGAHLKGQMMFATFVSPSKPIETPSSSPKSDQELPADQAVLNALKVPLAQGSMRWGAWLTHTGQVGTSTSLDAIWTLYKQPELTTALKRAGIYSKVSSDVPNRGALKGISSTHIKARMPRTSSVLAPLRPQLKELYDAHVAVGPELLGIGFGPQWQETLRPITQMLSQDQTGPKGVMKAFQTGAPHPFLFFYMNPIAFLSHLKTGKGGSMLLPLQMMAQGLSIDEGLSLSVGAEKGTVTLVLNLPFSLLNAFGKGFAGMGLTPPSSPSSSPSQITVP